MDNDPRNVLDEQLLNESVILKFIADNRSVEDLSEAWYSDFVLGIGLWGVTTGVMKKV